ncbi:MAG: hypothetical protein F6K14_29815, partial [Symploca sp. SIO2C1]|nr:hypothetical protein [Symploca sp. SIO2C1]
MQLLPYDTFSIQTPKPLSDVIEQLKINIEAPKAFRWSFSENHAPYTGTISNSGFEIRRLIQYRNSFLPNIQGRFESLSDGTRIRVTMRLHPLVMIFLLFWYSVWFTISIPYFLFGALSGDIQIFTALQFVGLPIVLLFVFWCWFWYEAYRSRQELKQIILGGTVANDSSSNLGKKQVKTSFLLPSALCPLPFFLKILAITAIILWNAVSLYLSPPVQRRLPSVTSKYCSQNLTESSYCNFSVIHSLEGHTTASALAMSADGKILVSGGEDKAIKVWDLQTGELRKTLQSDSGAINTLAIASDGKTIVSGSRDRMVRIWNLTSNQRPQLLKGHSDNINQVEISADGQTIISSTYNEIKVWDLATGNLKTTLPNLTTVENKVSQLSSFHPLTISRDGKTALVKLDGKFVVWDLASNQQKVLPKKWAFESIGSARISLDGNTVVTTTSSRKPVTLKVRDLKTGTVKAHRQIISSPEQSSLYNIALSHDGASTTAEAEYIISSTKEGLT